MGLLTLGGWAEDFALNLSVLLPFGEDLLQLARHLDLGRGGDRLLCLDQVWELGLDLLVLLLLAGDLDLLLFFFLVFFNFLRKLERDLLLDLAGDGEGSSL